MPDRRLQNLYLEDIPRERAWGQFTKSLTDHGLLRPLPSEVIDLDQALGRVLAEPIFARRSSPHYHAAAMDGYAIRSSSTAGVSDRNPKRLTLDKESAYVDTGDALPEGFDAVLPVEVVELLQDEKAIRIYESVPPWHNVRPMGEDIVTTELVLPAGHALRPIDLAAVAAAGYSSVPVVQKPRVAVIPTGSELIPIDQEPLPGQIPEFNSLMLASQVRSWGAEATRWPIVSDDIEEIRQAVQAAAIEHDLILINAGSSAGADDFTASVIHSLGQVLVHGVAVRPGHPVILGMIEPKTATVKEPSKAIPAIGVPGYPVSAALTADIFIEPLLRIWLGQSPPLPPTLEAVLTRKVHSTAGDEEHLRVSLGHVNDRWMAAPLSRGAGVISSLVRADGILVVPAGVQGLQAGEPVQVRLLRPRSELERTILTLGSHDLTLDLLAQHLSQRGRRLSSNNVGSIGGLLALSRGEAHLCGTHLLDPESGEYNTSYVRKYLPDRSVTLVALVRREQGLIVQKGNPKGISSITDLERPDILFVNRQKGSGTRILLDHHLRTEQIPPNSVRGYSHEEFTHLTVAAGVASGKVDCGLGIRAAASALKMDFIPIGFELYELVIPEDLIQSSLLAPLLEQLEEPAFQRAVEALDGYDASVMGSERTITPA